MYCAKDGNRVMVTPIAHKFKNAWDEEEIVAHIIADMKIAGRWFSALMPNLYFESGPYSGLMVTMSAPSHKIVPNMQFPGDIDILAIPYDKNELILSETLVIEIKIIRGEKRRPGKSPNKFGHSQATALVNHGFPHVAIGHIIVTNDPLNTPNREMRVATIGPEETVSSLEDIKLDMFENDLALRSFGKLKKICENDEIGYFVMNYDGKRIFEPLGWSCPLNPKCNIELFEKIGHFYEKNYRIFSELPRYSIEEAGIWEMRANKNPKLTPPWEHYRKIFANRRILTIEDWIIEVDGQKRIGHFFHMEDGDILLYKNNKAVSL